MPAPLSLDELNKRKPHDSKLTAIGISEYVNTDGLNRRIIICKCECGNIKTVRLGNFKSSTKSCGCLAKSQISKYPLLLRKVYWDMMSRCYTENSMYYHLYGGRGVRVCDEWVNKRISFLEWAFNNGYKKGLELDKDIKGNGMLYSPDTCVFVTHQENVRAISTTKRYHFRGRYITLAEIGDSCDIKIGTLWKRVAVLKWDLEKAVSTPLRNKKIKQ